MSHIRLRRASMSVVCSEIPDADINMMDLGIAGGIGLRAGMSVPPVRVR